MSRYRVQIEATFKIIVNVELDSGSEKLAKQQAESLVRDSLEIHTGEGDFEEDVDVEVNAIDAQVIGVTQLNP